MAPAPRARGDFLAREHLLGVLTPAVVSAGYDVEDVTVTTAGVRELVRVVVDADGGVDLDAVAMLSRTISELLDADTTLPGPFVLEVTSPGVERPLTQARHWRRAAGRLVRVVAAGQDVTGRVVTAGADGVRLVVDGTEHVFAYAELGPGHVQVEFSRADGE